MAPLVAISTEGKETASRARIWFFHVSFLRSTSFCLPVDNLPSCLGLNLFSFWRSFLRLFSFSADLFLSSSSFLTFSSSSLFLLSSASFRRANYSLLLHFPHMPRNFLYSHFVMLFCISSSRRLLLLLLSPFSSSSS